MSASPSPSPEDPGRAGRGLLTHSVGVGHRALNRPSDVRVVQHLLNLASPGAARLEENGRCDALLVDRIKAFQVRTLHFQAGDGRVDPGGRTLGALLEAAACARRPDPPPSSTSWYSGAVQAFDGAAKTAEEDLRRLEGYFLRARTAPSAVPKPPPNVDKPAPATGAVLADQDYRSAAMRIGPSVSAVLVHAFAHVESGGRSGMGPDGLPVIAFEGHVFRKFTGHAYDKTHPLLSYPFVVKSGPQWQVNNKTQKTAWATLKKAAALDEAAAYQACSWGMFQVMGFNYQMCKYSTVQDFVAAMKAGERGQLQAFVSYCLGKPGMANAMARKDYAGMAARYNGSQFGDYDTRIQTWYKKLGGV